MKVAADADANPYVRRQAVRAAGHLGWIGTKANPTETLDLILAIVNDQQADLALRSEAARAVGVFDYRKANLAAPESVARAVTALLVEIGRTTGGQAASGPTRSIKSWPVRPPAWTRVSPAGTRRSSARSSTATWSRAKV